MASILLAADPTKDFLRTVKKNVDEKKAVLVDVREQAEWDDGHLKAPVLLPLSDLKSGVDAVELEKRLPKNKVINMHCLACIRSCTAADVLLKYGYDVWPLKPGCIDLLRAGFLKANDRSLLLLLLCRDAIHRPAGA